MHCRLSLRIRFFYGLIYFCTSLIHNIFLVYHIHIFITSFGLSKFSFWVSEIIFLIWNSVNDPLFGWFIDKGFLGKQSTVENTVIRRARIISLCGPLLALAFVFAWFPHWLPCYPGLRFVIVLCSYDSVTTLLDLMKGALLADLAISSPDRARLGRSASIGQAVSASGLVGISWWVGDDIDVFPLDNPFDIPDSLNNINPISPEFQAVAFLLALFSATGIFYSGHWLANMKQTLCDSNVFRVNQPRKICLPVDKSDATNQTDFYRLVDFIFTCLRRPNFLAFSLMQMLQVFHCHFNSNFFPLFAKSLLGPNQKNMFCTILGVSFVLPHVNNIFLLKASETFGTYVIIRGLFVVKVVLGICLFVNGPSSVPSIALFLACNRVFTEGICKLLSQVVSDLVDEEFVLSLRSQPVSALIFGASSLLGRPGQTFAPLVGYTLLPLLRGKEPDHYPPDPYGGNSLQSACFTLLWSTTTVVGVMQLVIWSRYQLHGDNLAKIKKERLALEDKALHNSCDPAPLIMTI